LRTKLLPEQEKDMLALLTALNAAEAASSSAAASTSAEPLNFDESLGHRVANVTFYYAYGPGFISHTISNIA
jgi:hypothetical protein